MSRLWSRVGVRVLSVALLLVGVLGGFYLGRDREVQQRTAQVDMVVQAEQAEVELLKERHAEHAAARAPQRKAEADAAAKAAREAKAAAESARKLEAAAIEKADKEKAEKEKADKEKAEKEKAAAKKAGASPGGGESKPFDGPIPSSCGEYSGNRAIGCALVLDAGLDLEQMACLDSLFKKESGWNPKARNRSSGAYGIPQALPGNKMATVGDDWETNPATQIKWGLGYIKGRYGSPCKAWQHSQNVGWY